jgi:hypothetical protein
LLLQFIKKCQFAHLNHAKLFAFHNQNVTYHNSSDYVLAQLTIFSINPKILSNVLHGWDGEAYEVPLPRSDEYAHE